MACSWTNLAFGPYTGTYDGEDLGLIEQAWFLESQAEARDIRAARFGETIIDGIYLGQNAFMIVRLKEWTDAVWKAIHPWNTDTTGEPGKTVISELGTTGQHGRSMCSISKTLVLSVVPGTPAGNLGPATITAGNAIYAPRHNLQIPFGNLERDIHIVFQLYPTLTVAAPQATVDTSVTHFVMA